MAYYLRLIRYISPYKGKLIFAILCMLGASAAQLFLPWVIKDVIDDVFKNKDVVMLNQIIFAILFMFILRGFFIYGQGYFMSFVSERSMIDLKEDFFKRIQHFSLGYYERKTTGTMMSHFTNDIGGLQMAMLNSGVEFITESFVLIFSVGSMIILNWKLTALTFIAVPIIAFAIDKLGRKIRLIGGMAQERASEITSLIQEFLSGIRVVKSFAREEYELERFHKQNERNFRTSMKAVRTGSLLNPIVEFFAAIGICVVFWYGGMSVINDEITSGALIAFLFYAVNLSNPIKRISRTYAALQRSLANADRVFEVMDHVPDIQDKLGAKELKQIQGEVSFDHLGFEYKPGEPVLKDLNFTAKPGQMIALVGPSGSGKTTLVNLIPRFYEVGSGAISIDGTDIRDITQKSLREQIGIVPQETLLFMGTIKDNIRYGRLDATDEEIYAAAKAARVEEFVDRLPQGYDTQVGERGMSFSGGQRQRIAIARAILKNPHILILDEATSALDTESEKLVQEALEVLMENRTSFVIAHRLSTIFRADVILVLQHGVLVEHGTHQELLEKQGVYSNLYHTQFGTTREEGIELAPNDL